MRRLQCHWALGDLHDTYPLTRPLSFTIAADVEASEPSPASAPDCALSPDQQATGRHWSAKVGGCPINTCTFLLLCIVDELSHLR